MSSRRGGQPFFSVVMPTHQRRNSLERTLLALARQDYPSGRFELVLVLDGCTDGSAEMVESLELPIRVRLLEQQNQGPAAARNLGLACARGPLVLFLDDDVIPSPGLLAAHAKVHQDQGEYVVIGTLLPPEGLRAPWVQWELDTLIAQYAAMEAGRYRAGPRQFYTGNASVRMEHVVAVGGFDTGFRRGEDVELAFRLQSRGLRFVFCKEAAATHFADRSFRSWLKAAEEYGHNDVVLGLRRGRLDMLRAVGEEFWERSPLTQQLVRWTLSAPSVQSVLGLLGVSAAQLALSLRLRRLSHGLCSALFNLGYWRGVSDELGGPEAARRLIRAAVRAAEMNA